MDKIRLQKYLAEAGIASRRACEELILDGVVKVNGKVIEQLPAFITPDVDTITVNGKKVISALKVYFLLNKPKNIICTNKDPQGRRKAIDLVNTDKRVFCVGRLDADTMGAIILTNDNELCNRLTHPRYELPKTYVAAVKGKVQGEDIEKIKHGIWLAEGKTSKARLKVVSRNNKLTLLEIIISEGKKRQIRRMIAKVGYKIKTLKRTHIGKIPIKGVGTGQYRPLTKSEINYLKKATGLLE